MLVVRLTSPMKIVGSDSAGLPSVFRMKSLRRFRPLAISSFTAVVPIRQPGAMSGMNMSSATLIAGKVGGEGPRALRPFGTMPLSQRRSANEYWPTKVRSNDDDNQRNTRM